MKKNLKKNQGFTLIELMIVIAIIGILAAIAIPNFIAYRDKSYCSTIESDVHNAALSATGYLVDHEDLTDFTYAWSTNSDSGATSLDTTGVLTASANDKSKRCPAGKTFTIVGGSTSGEWTGTW